MEICRPDNVDCTVLDRLGDEIAELSAHLEAATARLLDLIREFDARGGWNSGFSSCAAWLSWRVGLDLGAARERVRVARALATLPRLAQALARGELSYAKVRALTRIATPETEERLLAVGRAGTARHVERIVRGWRRVDRIAEARETAQRHNSRALRVYQDEDGMVVIRGRLAPEAGAVILQALAAARETLYQQKRQTFDNPGDVSAETLPFEQQQADALALLAESAMHHGIDPGAPGERYQVVVHVDAPVLVDPDAQGQSVLEDGVRVSAETSRRLACDASRVVMQSTAGMAAPWRSQPGRAQYPQPYGGRYVTVTAAAASRAALLGSARATTSVTGPRTDPPRSRISRCYATATTAPFMRRVTSSSDCRTANSSSATRTGGFCRTSRHRRRLLMSPWNFYGR